MDDENLDEVSSVAALRKRAEAAERQLVGLREAVLRLERAEGPAEQVRRDIEAGNGLAPGALDRALDDEIAAVAGLRAALADAVPIADRVIAEEQERGARWMLDASRVHDETTRHRDAAEPDPAEVCRRARGAGASARTTTERKEGEETMKRDVAQLEANEVDTAAKTQRIFVVMTSGGNAIDWQRTRPQAVEALAEMAKISDGAMCLHALDLPRRMTQEEISDFFVRYGTEVYDLCDLSSYDGLDDLLARWRSDSPKARKKTVVTINVELEGYDADQAARVVAAVLDNDEFATAIDECAEDSELEFEVRSAKVVCINDITEKS